MKRLHFCGGEKGGVGKTFFCKVLIDYYEHLNLPLIVYDLDQSNPDIFNSGLEQKLNRSRRNLLIKSSFFSDNPEYMDSADEVIYDLLEGERDVVVNLPAGSYSHMQLWWNKNSFSELLAERNIQACYWFLLIGENFPYAERLISSWMMHVVLVRNLHLRTNWRVYDDLINHSIKTLVEQRPSHLPKYDITMIELESLSKSVADILVTKKLLIQDSYATGCLKLLDRQKLLTFCKIMYKELASTRKVPLENTSLLSPPAIPQSSGDDSDSSSPPEDDFYSHM